MATHSPLADLSQRLLGKAPGDLDDEERRVLAGIEAGTTVSRDAADVSDERSTFGERLSDRVAAIGGSWGFIIAFSAVLIGWMLLNSDILAHFGRAFDPYPYIFLNLLLSTVAAIQAPVIMMSQNRQSARIASRPASTTRPISAPNSTSCGCITRSIIWCLRASTP